MLLELRSNLPHEVCEQLRFVKLGFNVTSKTSRRLPLSYAVKDKMCSAKNNIIMMAEAAAFQKLSDISEVANR